MTGMGSSRTRVAPALAVAALLPDIQVTGVADQSGTDGKTTPGPLTAADVKTLSG